MAQPEVIETKKQFPQTPTGKAALWNVEMNAAAKNLEDFLAKGDETVREFLDDRSHDIRPQGGTRVNLFTANVQTLRALLYGKTPAVDVGRRWADPNDDIARVGGEILERLLNTDIEKDDDNYAEALENALSDRLLSGLGVVRMRYEAEFGEEKVDPLYLKHPSIDPMTGQPHPQAGQDVEDEDGGKLELAPGYTKQIKNNEEVETDYVHWRDFRYSPARTWSEVRWIAFRCPMTKEQLQERFPKHAALIPMESGKSNQDGKAKTDKENDGERWNPWARAEVWEIWSKTDRKVYWWVKGYSAILDEQDDPYGLTGFWPIPRPMFANATTTKLVATPDYYIAKDLYAEINMLSSRITLLERAIAARGVYDKTSDEIKRLLSEAIQNELIPVDNFAMFKEKGGLQSVVDWLPLDIFVGALDKLREYRQELMALLFQVTGMSDIMRGQASGNATATEQALKAKFASTRIQELQNEFARFASEAQAIKAELISKHFDPETILQRSNVQYMFGNDPQMAQQAVGLIKSDLMQYRIEVKPESVAMADMTAVKQERAEFLLAVAQFFQSSVPVVQVAPFAVPYLLQILQWSMAGFRGGSSIEAVLDQMVVAARQAAAAPKPPDPQIELEKMKFEMEKQKASMDIQAKKMDMALDFQKAQMDMHVQKQKAATDLQVQQQKAQVDVAKAQMDHEVSVKQMESDLQGEAQKMALEDRKAQLEADRTEVEHKQALEHGDAKHKQAMQQAKEKQAAKPKGDKK